MEKTTKPGCTFRGPRGGHYDMSNLDTVIAVVFALVVFVTGISFLKAVRNTSSFFAAGGAVPWWVAGISLYMSFFSANTFVVWGGIAYSDGLVSVSIQATMCIAGLLIGFVIAPKWNRTNALTAAEYIGDRFGDGLRKAYTTLFLFISMFATGAFLYPVGKIIEVSTGIPLETCILVLGVLILIYTAVGGLWAVLVTDVLQFVVLGAAVIILVPLAFSEVGGVAVFVERAPEGFFALQNEKYTWGFLVAFLVYNTFFIGGNWAYVQRYTSVASPKDARKVGWIFGGLYAFSPIIWMLPPMIYRVIQPDLQGLENEGAYLLVAQQVVPSGLLGLILGSMVFATASSVNTTLNISSGVFTNDLYRFFRKAATPGETMLVARLSTVVFGILTILVALSIPRMGGSIAVVLSVAAITGAALFMPPIWAMFSHRQNAVSVLSATLVSLAANLFYKFFAPDLLGITLSRSEEMILGVLGPIMILLAFELLFRLRGYVDPRMARYLELRNRKGELKRRERDSATSGAANRYGKLVISYGVLAIGALIFLLGMLADDARLLVALIGGFIVIVSLANIRRTRAATL